MTHANDKNGEKDMNDLVLEYAEKILPILPLAKKAYDTEIQKCVVTMKDELEKAKEQILNVL